MFASWSLQNHGWAVSSAHLPWTVCEFSVVTLELQFLCANSCRHHSMGTTLFYRQGRYQCIPPISQTLPILEMHCWFHAIMSLTEGFADMSEPLIRCYSMQLNTFIYTWHVLWLEYQNPDIVHQDLWETLSFGTDWNHTTCYLNSDCLIVFSPRLPLSLLIWLMLNTLRMNSFPLEYAYIFCREFLVFFSLWCF